MQGDASDDEEGERISCGLLVISNYENRSWSTRLDVHNRPVSRFGREMATNRKTAGWGERISHNDHSPRVGVEPANTREHVFEISRVRQVPLACKASAGSAYARFTPLLFSLPFFFPVLIFERYKFSKRDVEERESESFEHFCKWIDSLLKTDGFRVRNDLEDNAVTIESRYYGTVMSDHAGEKDRAAPGYSTKSVEIRIYTRLVMLGSSLHRTKFHSSRSKFTKPSRHSPRLIFGLKNLLRGSRGKCHPYPLLDISSS